MAKDKLGGKRKGRSRFSKDQENFMNDIVKEIVRDSKAPFDPENLDNGLTNTDIQGMVEAFAMTNNLSFKEENDLQTELNKRIRKAFYWFHRGL